jgi:hypothetical protein
VELATGRWCYHICRKAVSATFTAFCEQLLATSPTLTIQGRVRQVDAFFRARSPTQILTTAAPHSSPWLPEGHMQNVRQAA